MSTSNITLTIEVEHTDDIPTASEITRLVAGLLAKPLAGHKAHEVRGYGRVAFVGGEIGSGIRGLRVQLDSAAIITGAGKARPAHYVERDGYMPGWNLMCRRYGEATATGLTYQQATAEAKESNEVPGYCGCAD